MQFRREGLVAKRAMRMLAWLLVAAPVTIAQTQSVALNMHRRCAGSRQVAGCPGGAPVHIVREIKDPHSGTRWLIIGNAQNPAGPARIELASGIDDRVVDAKSEKTASSLVIHVGDRVVLEEHTTVVESYFDAVALGPAVAGATLDLRLKIKGKVVRAVAIAPGKAVLDPFREERP